MFRRLPFRYRLAPEHPYPTPFQDCLDATKHFLQHAADLDVDPKRVAVAGTLMYICVNTYHNATVGENWELDTNQSVVSRATTPIHKICKGVKMGIQLACLQGISVS